MNTHKKSLRGATPALTSVASAAALLLLSGGAQAASFSIGLPFGQPSAIAQIVADGYNTNMTAVQAQVINNGVNTSQVGAGINTTVGNTGNTIGALAAGNRSAQSISTLAAAPNVPGQGAVAYAVAQNQGSITSLAGSNTISNTMGSLTGSSTVTGNQIYADTTVNEDRNTIAGQLPNGFNLNTAGNGAVNVSGLPASPSVTAQGGLVAVSTQNSLEQTSSGSSAISNTVALVLNQSIGNSLTGTATLDKNQVSATFRGNDADNSVAVAAGGAPSYVGSAVAGNVQTRNGANSFADALGNTVLGSVGAVSSGSVRGSLSVQGNAVGSEASGNSADNAVTLADSLSVNGMGAASSMGTAQTLGGLVVASNQSNTGNAALRSDTRSTLIAAQAGELTDSTVVAAGNAVSSQALGNTVTNGISNVGSTAGVSSSTIAGSALIGNVQANQIGVAAPGVNGDIWARTEGTQIQASAATGSGVGRNAISASSNTVSAQAAASSASNTVDLQGAVLSLNWSNTGVTVAPAAANVAVGAGVLNSQRNITTDVTSENNGAAIAVFNGGATLNSTLQANTNALTSVASGNGSDNTVQLKGVTVNASTAVVNQQTNDTSRILATLGAAAAPYTVSVAAASGSASASQLSVDGNSGLASATANAATNRLAVSGTTLASNTSSASSSGTVGADHVLSNDQQVTRTVGVASGQRASANGVLSVQGGVGGLTASNSTLSLADNVQDARALGNTATNTLSLTGTALDSRSALASSQASSASVTSDSVLTLSAGATSSTQSSVTLDSNRNTALATTNRAFNTLQVQGTNVGAASSGFPASINAAAIPPQTNADHVLTNQQFGGGEQASSFASTSLNNVTQGASADRSTLAATGNVTWAESVVNYAANTLDVAGTANLRSAAALYNNQTNTTGTFNGGAGVTATSQTNVGGLNRYTFGLNSAVGSSVALNDNTTVALAYGNSAANALNAVAGGTYNGLTVATSTSVTPYNVVGAQYALLNNQGNLSNVSASSSAVYDIGAAGAMTATNSALNAAGNSVAALAYGNSATNALQVAALNSGMPTAAVSSAQTNTGVITATASSSSVGIAGAGALGSSLVVRGNQITATAVGNSSTSTIQAAR